MVIFLLTLPLTAWLVWKIISMEKKRRKRTKQIERDIHSPGMEDVRKFLKPDLKKQGVNIDDKYYERQ